jgi:DNA-binding GntR family transcriptional regulator
LELGAHVTTTRESLADRLFDAVKRDIVEFRLPPDTILGEANLAAQHSVSRAPAREALKRLSTLGFVRGVPRVGYIVTGISVRDFDEIFGLRLAVEPLAVRLAVPRMTAADVDRLQAHADGVHELADVPEVERGAALARVNAAFHREIAHIAGNARLERVIAGLLDELERLVHMLAYSPAKELVIHQHPLLLETMKSGDPNASAELMQEQLARDYEVMRALAVAPVRPPATLAPTVAAQQARAVAR